MFEKLIPIIIALIAIQLLMKYLNKRKKKTPQTSGNLDYKRKIDEFLKISDFDQGYGNEKQYTDEIRSKLSDPDLIAEIPESMSDLRRSLYLIIDAVTHGVKGKAGSGAAGEVKYNEPAKMYDEIVEVINRHKK